MTAILLLPHSVDKTAVNKFFSGLQKVVQDRPDLKDECNSQIGRVKVSRETAANPARRAAVHVCTSPCHVSCCTRMHDPHAR